MKGNGDKMNTQTNGNNALTGGFPPTQQGGIPGFSGYTQPQQQYQQPQYQQNYGGYGQQQQQPVNTPIDLSQVNKILTGAIPAEKIETPAGTYQTKVSKIEMMESQKTGNPMIHWELEHIGGSYTGAKENFYDVIPLFDVNGNPINLQDSTPDQWGKTNAVKLQGKFSLIKGRFKTLGVDTSGLGDMEDFQKLFGAVLDVPVEIRKTVKNENSNIYFNKRLFLNQPQQYQQSAPIQQIQQQPIAQQAQAQAQPQQQLQQQQPVSSTPPPPGTTTTTGTGVRNKKQLPQIPPDETFADEFDVDEALA